MTVSRPRRYWDTSAFTALITKEANRWEDCEALLLEAEQAKWRVITSTLTLAEVNRASNIGILTAFRETIEHFFEQSFIQLVTVDRPIAVAARGIMFEHGLRPADAIHVASAARANCGVLYTYDKQISRLNGKLGPLQVGAPIWQGQPELPGISRTVKSERQNLNE